MHCAKANKCAIYQAWPNKLDLQSRKPRYDAVAAAACLRGVEAVVGVADGVVADGPGVLD